MSILTGNEIDKQIREGNIIISSYDKSRLNPNSYNLTIGDRLQYYSDGISILDSRGINPTKEIAIPETGYTLWPETLYLACTEEYTWTEKYVPVVDGRSSIGRLGIGVHVTAGFGDIGFSGKWTLEIFVVEPIIVYPNMEIAQIYFHTIEGNNDIKYTGKYQDSTEIVPSKLWKEYAYNDMGGTSCE